MSHNIQFETSTPDYIKERNEKLLDAYKNLINTIDYIQGFLEEEYLRGRVESDMTKRIGTKSTMYQCTTPFCIISLGCDDMGRYNLVYSVDHRFQKMIGETLASSLIRQVYHFTPGELKKSVQIGSLYHRCAETYDQISVEMQTESFHLFYLKEKNS